MSKLNYLVISVVLFIRLVANSSQDCRILQNYNNLQYFWCKTVQDLELNGNSKLLDAQIHDGNGLPVQPSNQTIPNLQITLSDGAENGLSPETYKILKDLSNSFSKNRKITVIPKGLFENLKLQKLQLYNNGIETIQVGAFSNMPYLQELFIRNNNLRIIEPGIFNSLGVNTLDLSNNKISVIKRNALFNMKNLKNLHLDGNSLTEFRPDLFLSYGSQLETLYLQRNYLTDIDRNSLKSLDNLKVLNLGSNSISRIVIYTFENLLRLEHLILSSNQIQELEADVFANDGMPSLTKIEINNNKLLYLTPKVLGRLTNLKYIRLGGNPWMCACYEAIIRWLNDHNIEQFCDYEYYSGSRPICVVPDRQSTVCDYIPTSNRFIQNYLEADFRGTTMCSV